MKSISKIVSMEQIYNKHILMPIFQKKLEFISTFTLKIVLDILNKIKSFHWISLLHEVIVYIV